MVIMDMDESLTTELTENLETNLNNNCPLPEECKNYDRYKRCEYVYSNFEDILDENERMGVEDWQDEIFSPEKTFKTLDNECKARSKFYDDCLDELLQKGCEWLAQTHKDGYICYETAVLDDNGQKIHVLDCMMQHRHKNPMLTNMSVEELIPGSWMPKNVMNVIFDVSSTLGGDNQGFRQL